MKKILFLLLLSTGLYAQGIMMVLPNESLQLGSNDWYNRWTLYKDDDGVHLYNYHYTDSLSFFAKTGNFNQLFSQGTIQGYSNVVCSGFVRATAGIQTYQDVILKGSLDIHTDDTDGSDDRRTRITGGGEPGTSRGGTIELYGEEYSGYNGDVRIIPGSSGQIELIGDIEVNGSIKILTGTGTPESAVSASVGSLYLRTDGGAGTTLYVKESGTGNTGWVAK